MRTVLAAALESPVQWDGGTGNASEDRNRRPQRTECDFVAIQGRANVTILATPQPIALDAVMRQLGNQSYADRD